MNIVFHYVNNNLVIAFISENNDVIGSNKDFGISGYMLNMDQN